MGESDVKFVFRSSKAVSSLEQQDNASTYRIPMPISVVPSSEPKSTAQKGRHQRPPSITELRQQSEMRCHNDFRVEGDSYELNATTEIARLGAGNPTNLNETTQSSKQNNWFDQTKHFLK